MSVPLLEARDVSVTFGGASEAVRAVIGANVHVCANEAVGIVGESGSGKSTLARALVGLQRPDQGDVLLEGRSVYGSDGAYQRNGRRKVQMVFQDPYGSLNPSMRVVSAVAEAVRRWDRSGRDEAQRAAFALLASMGIGARDAVKRPRTMSGGQRQRINVARALAPGPSVLVADEPTSAIDQSAQAQLLNLLRQLQESRGLAVVFISHDLGVIRYLTSRVYVMRRGEIVETGPTEAVMRSPEHDYTKLLLSSIPGAQQWKRPASNGVAALPGGRPETIRKEP
jgi:peptide/nickel transport system ATP-binding protein